MDKIITIGLSGPPGSGKDAIARCLDGFERIAFADSMRGDLLKLDPIIHSDDGASYARLSVLICSLGWDDAKRQFGEIRRLLQAYGSEVGRDGFGDRCWINRVDRKILASKSSRFVITDVRFQNEVDYHSAMHGPLWYVERPGVSAINGHVSEQSYGWIRDRADAVIVNDGSIAKLKRTIETELARWMLMNDC